MFYNQETSVEITVNVLPRLCTFSRWKLFVWHIHSEFCWQPHGM